MSDDRAIIIIHDSTDNALAARWAKLAKKGSRIEFKGPKRTLPQNDRIHAMITDIATQCVIGDPPKRYTVKDWKIILLTAFADEKGVEMRSLPAIHRAGLIPCGRSTSDLSVAEASEFIDWLFATGAQMSVTWKNEQEKPSVC